VYRYRNFRVLEVLKAFRVARNGNSITINSARDWYRYLVKLPVPVLNLGYTWEIILSRPD
jgi:hypothetical protein